MATIYEYKRTYCVRYPGSGHTPARVSDVMGYAGRLPTAKELERSVRSWWGDIMSADRRLDLTTSMIDENSAEMRWVAQLSNGGEYIVEATVCPVLVDILWEDE